MNEDDQTPLPGNKFTFFEIDLSEHFIAGQIINAAY